MVILDQDRRLARGFFNVAIGQVLRLGSPSHQTLAQAALDAPGPLTIRALVQAGQGEPWLASVRDALAEVGIAGSENVLGVVDMDLEQEEYRPVVAIARQLIADAKAKRLAAFGPAIPRGWSKAVQEAYPDVWRYWPSVPGGWIDLVMALSEHLRLAAPGAQIEDSKEKYGGMRTSVTGDESMPPEAFDLSDIYEELSNHVCQDCGEPGTLRIGGWDATLCDIHAEKRDMQ